jgi:hypothetical protein
VLSIGHYLLVMVMRVVVYLLQWHYGGESGMVLMKEEAKIAKLSSNFT